MNSCQSCIAYEEGTGTGGNDAESSISTRKLWQQQQRAKSCVIWREKERERAREEKECSQEAAGNHIHERQRERERRNGGEKVMKSQVMDDPCE